MGLLDLFRKGKNDQSPQKQEKRLLSVEEVVRMAQMHEPASIYEIDGRSLVPMVANAVNQIMPFYDGFSNVSTILMLHSPDALKENIRNADADTLLIFFKFLAIKASEVTYRDPIGLVQNYMIPILQQKLS